MECKREILILSVSKTKGGKSILTYGMMPESPSDYKKGYIICEDWCDTEKWFSLDNLVGKVVQVIISYETTYSNKVRPKIIEITK